MYSRTLTTVRSDTVAKDLVLTVLFAAATAFGAQIAVRLPFSPVPLTLQVLMVIASGLALGARRGLASQVCYLTAGVLGLPVFAGGTGGPAVLVGPTGGYLMAFPAAAFAAGWLSERLQGGGRAAVQGRGRVGSILAALVAITVLYGVGSLWLGVWLRATTIHSLPAAYAAAWSFGVKPFILVDLAKAFLAAAGVQGGRHLLTRWFGAEL
jgi:biotin transport system substrate-specific component